jgi:hypothetical protein
VNEKRMAALVRRSIVRDEWIYNCEGLLCLTE